MRHIALNKKGNILFIILFFGILGLKFMIGCSSDGNNSYSDIVKASPFDGSVEIVENFLKKRYLNDPDSYKSVEWGKLIKHSDGSFMVTHRFSAKNGFGGVNTETLIFHISPDGQEVRISSESEERHLRAEDEAAEKVKADNEYIAKNFSNTLFEGTLTETIEGIAEKYTFRGELNKVGNEIQGNLVAIEKNTSYRLTGNIKEEGKVDFKLENLSNGSAIQMNGIIVVNALFTLSSGTEFYLKHSN